MISYTSIIITIYVALIVLLFGVLFEGSDTKHLVTLGNLLITIGIAMMAFISLLSIISVICMLFGIEFIV